MKEKIQCFLKHNHKVLSYIVFALIVIFIVFNIHREIANENSTTTETTITESTMTETETETETTIETETEVVTETETETEEITEEPTLISLGTFKLTAYCSCKTCCGKWAEGRPVDSNGNEIIYGSSGTRLTAGESVAVDTSVIPYGTHIIINGKEYVARDTGYGVVGNHIDIYFNSHEEACQFGLQYAEVFVVKDKKW